MRWPSVYRIGLSVVPATALVLLSIVRWQEPLTHWAGELLNADPKLMLPFVGVPAFGLLAILSGALTNCPRCSESAFHVRMLVQKPWPNKNCSGCGLDLRAYHPFEDVDEHEPDTRRGDDNVQS